MKILIEEGLDIIEEYPNSRLIGLTPNELKAKGFPVDILFYKPFWSMYAFVFNDLLDEMKDEKISSVLLDKNLGKLIIVGDRDSSQELGELQDKKFK